MAVDVGDAILGTGLAGAIFTYWNRAYIRNAPAGYSDNTWGAQIQADLARQSEALAEALAPYLNATSSGPSSARGSVLAVATTNVTPSGLGGVIDGVTLSTSDRVLLTGQTVASQNGIWAVEAAGWARPGDFLPGTDAACAFVFVQGGTVNADSLWLCTTNSLAIIDTTPLVWIQFPAAGAGLTGTGPTINVGANPDGSIAVGPDNVGVGVLATDAQHGVRGGGLLHAVATPSVAGFESAADKTKLDGISPGAAALTSNPPANVTKAAAAVGVGTAAARDDHKHDISTAAPVAGAVVANGTATEGTATTLARSDHLHAVSVATPVDVGNANAPGSAATFVRSDHIHNLPYGAIAGVAPGATEGKDRVRAVSTTNIASLSGLATTVDGVALNTDGFRVLLAGQTTASQNGIWLVHSGAWTRPVDFATGLSAACSYVFVDQGTSNADTGWLCTSNIGSDVVDTNSLAWQQFTSALTSSAPVNVNKSAAAAGTSGTAARSDHKHDIDTATTAAGAVQVGGAAAEGTATSLARSDHVHTVSRGTPVDIGNANAAGSAATFAGSDHVHNLPLSAISTVAPGAVQSKGSVSVVATTNQATLSGTAQTIDGVALTTVGTRVLLTAQTTATQNGIWAVQSGAWTRPSDFATGSDAGAAHVFVQLGAVNADTFWFCTDNSGGAIVDTHNLVWVMFPSYHILTFVVPGALLSKDSARAVATTNVATMSGTAQTVDGVALSSVGLRVLLAGQTTASQNGIWVIQSGTWTRPIDFATGDHAAAAFVFVQGGTSNADSGWLCTNNTGADTIDTFNLTWAPFTTSLTSSAPVNVDKSAAAVGTAATAARADHKHDINTATTAAGAVVAGGSAAEGTATTIARSDHIHTVSVAAPVAIGTANAAGSASTFVRSDHVHDHGAQTVGTLHAAFTNTVNGFAPASGGGTSNFLRADGTWAVPAGSITEERIKIIASYRP